MSKVARPRSKLFSVLRLGKLLTVLWVPACLCLQFLVCRALGADARGSAMFVYLSNIFGALLSALVGAIAGWVADCEGGGRRGVFLFGALYLWPFIFC